ncbi:MAG: ABC transporter permease [Bacillota bacterium]
MVQDATIIPSETGDWPGPAPSASGAVANLRQPLPWWQRLWRLGWLRKGLLIATLAGAWQAYATWLSRPLLLPTFSATALAFYDALVHGELICRVATSVKILLIGYAAGVVLAAALAILAASTRLGADLLETLASMLNPLPAIALIPLALLWFGLGAPSMIFVLIHAVLWPVALNAHAGFTGINPTLRMVGQNYGLSRLSFAVRILIPAALPSILTGLKHGWAFAWRTLIAAELVFGVSSGSGGLGWFIYEMKTQLETAAVFAGLGTVILIGLLIEHCVFRPLESRTIRRWGMRQ